MFRRVSQGTRRAAEESLRALGGQQCYEKSLRALGGRQKSLSGHL